MRVLNDISLIDRQQWSALVDRSPVASVFQTPEMFDFLVGVGLFEVRILGVEEDGVLKGLVVCQIHSEGKGLKKRLSTRAIVNGGPLLDANITQEALASLLNSTVAALRQSCVYIESRNFNDYSPWRTVFESCGFRYMPHYNYHLDTSSAETMESNMGKSCRRNIRYTLNEGAVASEVSTVEEVDAFYCILQSLYREKVKRPLFPLAFFRQIVNMPFAHIVVAKLHGEVIGGTLCLELRGRVVYEWFVCGKDHEWHHVHPSELATYSAMCLAVEHGCNRYDMMGAGEPGKSYGVRDHKAHFGGALVEHGRYLLRCKPLVYEAGKLAIKIISK